MRVQILSQNMEANRKLTTESKRSSESKLKSESGRWICGWWYKCEMRETQGLAKHMR